MSPGAHRDKTRETQLDWPETWNSEWVKRKWGMELELDPIDLAELDALAQPFSDTIEVALARHREGTELALRHKWQMGQFERSPLTTEAFARRPMRAFWSASTAGGGRAVRIELYPEDHPDLIELEREYVGRRFERDAAVRAWLRQRRG